MQPLTQYYVRARHRSSGGKVSDWSAGSSFATNDPAASDYFGQSVSLSGNKNVALIGAYGKNSYKGTTYVFI